MSRGLGKIERQILDVLSGQAVGLTVRALAEALPGLQVRSVRRAVQRLERQGALRATFQAARHAQSWGGISRVKLVSLARPKVEIQDEGATYTPGSRPYVRRRYLERARKRWQDMERRGYALLPGVRKRDVYEAIGAVIHWQSEESIRCGEYDRAWRPIGPTVISGEEVRQARAVWHQAQDLLDQARLQLTALVKEPSVSQKRKRAR